MMKANDSFEKIMEWILSADSIALAGHLNPDGDAIGACLALGGALEKAGKKVQVILEKYADKYHLSPNGHLVVVAEKAEVPELFQQHNPMLLSNWKPYPIEEYHPLLYRLLQKQFS